MLIHLCSTYNRSRALEASTSLDSNGSSPIIHRPGTCRHRLVSRDKAKDLIQGFVTPSLIYYLIYQFTYNRDFPFVVMITFPLRRP